jgi:hypothetical protein
VTPQVGDVYKMPMKTFHADGTTSSNDWHLLVLELVDSIPYKDNSFDCVVRCLVLESGSLHSVYEDVLLADGVKVS